MASKFNASDHEPSTLGTFDIIPADWYTMTITGSDIKPSDKADDMLVIEFAMDANIHPQFANRKIWTNLCINHPGSDKAREISNGQLSAICHAIGRMNLTHPHDLIGGTLQVKVGVSPAKDGYEARNDAKSFKGIAEAPPVAQAPKVAAGSQRRPWAKK